MSREDSYPPELPRSGDDAVASYQAHVEKNLARQRESFRGHLGTFLGVNGMLFVIWATTGGGFPWFLIPMFGWGIGLSSHYAGVKTAEEEYRHLSRLGKLRRNVANLYRKLAKSRRSWTGHLVSTLATSALLLVINTITWGGFPWALIPIAGLSIGLFSHYPSFRAKERRLIRELAEEGVDVRQLERGLTLFSRRLTIPGRPSSRGDSVPGAGSVEEQAENLRETILRQMKESGGVPLGDDFKSSLDGFVRQVKELSGTRREIERIVSEIPMEALEKDLRELRSKRQSTESERMAAEYDRSIAELERQERSYRSLKEDAEMIRLRINSALNALKQISIDLVRMRSADKSSGSDTADALRKRSEELSSYIDDLHRAYEELE